MVLKARNAILPLMGAALVLQAGGCKKDKDNKTDLLVGEWEVVEVDGDEPYSTITFKFDEDKDFRFCGEYYGTQKCYDGGWDWVGSDEDEVEFEYTDDDGDDYQYNIEIETLKKDELVGELIDEDGESYDIVLEKK